jgi:putative tricarboxylic transport membrane protein
MYGGSTTSILLNTPGESASIVTAIEGNQMARQGRGGPALATAAIGSFVAGLLATLALAFLAPHVVKLALTLGPREYFALMVLAFVTVSATFGDSTLRGLTSLFVGLALACIGIDQLTGATRLAFGVPQLLDGIEVTTLAVAMFALGEAFFVAGQGAAPDGMHRITGRVSMNRAEWGRSWKAWLRGTAIGFPIGSMPAGGADVASFLSYATERKMTRHPEEFGHGAIEGVAGPEAANNAAAAGTLVPLLTLGLPTTATAAIMLAGFQQFGLQPGPLLFVMNADLVWGLIASLLIANVMLVVLNLPLIGLWIKLLTIPRPWLYGGILVFATLGCIGINPSPVELGMLIGFGVMGYAMRLYGYPIAPVVVGLILGPMAEQQLRRALAIAQGDWMSLVSTPVSGVLMTLSVLFLIVPLILRARGRGKTLSAVAGDSD